MTPSQGDKTVSRSLSMAGTVLQESEFFGTSAKMSPHHCPRLTASTRVVGRAKGSDHFLLTAFFNCVPGENFGTFLAGILRAAPV